MAGATPSLGPVGGFESTQWSIVASAQSRHTPAGEAAMATLCGRYWRPLYCYVRRRGYSAEEAQDLTQAYFARLLEKNFLDRVDAERGKFRSFLLASLKHFLANEWDRNNAIKRGGGVEFLTVDEAPAVSTTPEQVYERNWAIAVLDRATSRLASEFAAAGKGDVFEALKGFLEGGDHGSTYVEIAKSLGMSEGAVRVAVHRMRDRFRAIVRTEIAQTIAKPSESGSVDAELRYLLSVM